MTTPDRMPVGDQGVCPICEKALAVESPAELHDGTCPHCDQLLWFHPEGPPLPAAILVVPLENLDASNHREMEWRIQRAATKSKVLLLDLGNVNFISSEAVATLLRSKRQLGEDGGDLFVRNPRPFVQQALEVLGLLGVLLLED